MKEVLWDHASYLHLWPLFYFQGGPLTSNSCVIRRIITTIHLVCSAWPVTYHLALHKVRTYQGVCASITVVLTSDQHFFNKQNTLTHEDIKHDNFFVPASGQMSPACLPRISSRVSAHNWPHNQITGFLNSLQACVKGLVYKP